jgi:hypothetical protein
VDLEFDAAIGGFLEFRRIYRVAQRGAGGGRVFAADAAFRLAEDLQESVATLEPTTNDQRQTIEGMVSKVIPAEPVPLKFEDKI